MAQVIGYRFTCKAKGLDRKDAGGLGKSDPFLVFKVNQPQSGKSVVIFKSEVIQNNLKPTWKPFEIFLDDVYGPTTAITIEVYDYDDDGTFDFIGGTSSTINELIQGKYERPLINPQKQGRMLYKNSGILSVDKFEPIDASQRRPVTTGFRLKLHATKLDSKDANLSSDPFFVIYGTPAIQASRPYDPTAVQAPPAAHAAPASHGSKKDKKKDKGKKKEKTGGKKENKSVIYKSPVIKKNLNPQWPEFDLDVLSCGGLDSPIAIEVYDYDDDATHDFIGSCHTTLRELTFDGAMFALINKGKSRPGYRNSGTLKLAASTRKSDPIPAPPFGFKLQLSATKLDSKDLNGKSDPYFTIKAKPYGAPQANVVYKSEVHPKVTNVQWNEFAITIGQTGGYDAEIVIDIFDEDKRTKDDLIGTVNTTFRELLFTNAAPFRVVNPAKLDRGALYRNSGILKVDRVTPDPSVQPPQPQVPQGYPQGYPPQGYPPQGYPPQGYPPQGYPPQGYPPQGYPPQGYPPQGYPPQGYPPQGYPPQGYPPQGYPPQGYPPQAYPGYPPQAYPQAAPQGQPPQQPQGH